MIDGIEPKTDAVAAIGVKLVFLFKVIIPDLGKDIKIITGTANGDLVLVVTEY